jgi:mono/diheme cytochrome c family protein
MYHRFARCNATLALLAPILFMACDSGSLGIGRTATGSPPALAPMATPPPAAAPMVAPVPTAPPSPPMVVPPPDPTVVVPPAPVPPPPPPMPPAPAMVSEMPPAVYALLQQKCATCHTYGQADRAGWGSVLATSQMIAADIIVPGNTSASRLWNRVAVRGDMPFGGKDRLGGAELSMINAWITSLQRPAMRPRSNEQILDLLVRDARSQGGQSGDLRYLSFAHYADEHRPPEELRAARAVMNVVINSVSRGRSLVQPQPIDAEQSIFRFRLGDLGWDERTWDRVTSFYPYCLRSERQPHRDLYNQLRTEAPFVRGDWFIDTVLQPPLYDDVLGLAKNLDEIARQDLGLDINDDIARGNVERIGFRSSGVSLHNRVFERHRTRVAGNGYLWVSYDFDTDLADGDIRANPLGPRNRDQRFPHSFQNLAGEMIWSLPNGMQGYLLALADGTSIDKAVQTVVTDKRRPDGSVENGISCLGCHGITGMNQPRTFDEIPRFAQEHAADFGRDELAQIRRLYPENGQPLLQADAAHYLTRVRALAGDLLPNPGAIEYDDFINLYGSYEAKLGLHAGTLELQADPAQVAREVRTRGDNEGDLPLTLSDPLVTRDDWSCRFRRIIRDVRRVSFCANTFDAAEVGGFCDKR